MVSGVVRFDVPRMANYMQAADADALRGLGMVPDGAPVLIELHDRHDLAADAVRLLAEHADRLDVRIVGTDVHLVGRVVRAARSGDLREWEALPW